jgi:hypothetical protein
MAVHVISGRNQRILNRRRGESQQISRITLESPRVTKAAISASFRHIGAIFPTI